MNNLKELEELKKRHIEYINSLEYNRETANKKWTDSIDRADTEYYFRKKGLEDRKHINYHPVCNYNLDDQNINVDGLHLCFCLNELGRACTKRLFPEHIYKISLNNNSFKTIEDAEQQEKINNAIIKVNKRIDELNNGWIADYNQTVDMKYEINYNHNSEELSITTTTYQEYLLKIKAFKSRDIFNILIEEILPELELIFEVEK